MVATRILLRVWCAPNDLAGLVVAGIARLFGGGGRWVDGVLEVHGRGAAALLSSLPFVPGGAGALTLGHVVVGRDEATLRAVRVHERAHVRQYERWGPLFLPAYAALGGWCLLRRRHPWRDHPFEREAFAAEERPAGSGAAAGRHLP